MNGTKLRVRMGVCELCRLSERICLWMSDHIFYRLSLNTSYTVVAFKISKPFNIVHVLINKSQVNMHFFFLREGMRGAELLLLYCYDFSTGGNSIQTSVIFLLN